MVAWLKLRMRWWTTGVSALLVATLTAVVAWGDDRSALIWDEPEIVSVNPTWISGLQIANDSSTDRACAWAISYPEIPEAQALTDALRDRIDQSLDAFLDGRHDGDSTRCGAADGGQELNVSFSFIVASGDVVGIRLTTVDVTATGSRVDTASYWYDALSNRMHTAAALVDDSASDHVAAKLKRALSARVGVNGETLAALDDPQRRADMLTDLAFTSSGDLVVTLPSSAAADAPAGAMTVVLPQAQVRPLLSGFGWRAQQQAIRPAQRLAPASAPRPSPPPPSPSPALPSPDAPFPDAPFPDAPFPDAPFPDAPFPAASPPAASPAAKPSPDAGGSVDCRQVKCVALTFDDGPAPETDELLVLLARHQARATFFVVGQNVARYPRMLQAMVTGGHEIGNHTWSHRDMTRLTDAELADELNRTDEAIQAAVGLTPKHVRPPYGAFNGSVRTEVDRPLILWSVDPRDWENRDSAYVADAVLEAAQPGDIVLMHDIHATTVAAVPEILAALKEDDYHFVTVSELLGQRALAPNTAWSHNPQAYGRANA